jgi:hypothetical protein
MPNIIECSSEFLRALESRVSKVIMIRNCVWRKIIAMCGSPLCTVREGKWPLFLVLTFLVGSEFFLPVRVQAQSFNETGLFYFTGSHQPLRSAYFREFMTGPGVGDGLKAGPVRLHPFLGVAEVYTDNVFRRDKNRKSDFLTTIAPGLQAFLPFGGGKHSVLLDYRAGQFLYNKFTENNALAQDALGHVSLNYPGGLQIDLQGGHIEGFDPRGSEVDTQQQDITKWNVNHVLSQVEFLGQKAGIRLRSSFLDLHYKNNGQDNPRDRTRVTADLSVFASVTPSTRALLGVRIVNNDYDKNKQQDSFGYGVFTGFRLAPTRQLSGELSIGYQVLNFDRAPIPEDQPVSSGLSRGSKQQTALYMQGNLNWNPTSRLSIAVRPFSSINQSAVQNTSTFRQTGVNLFGRQAFTDRLALRGNFYYANDNFDTSRTDNRFRLRIGPEYRTLKWLGFRLDYIFEKRSSNEANFDYYSNTVMLSIEGIL